MPADDMVHETIEMTSTKIELIQLDTDQER